MSTLLVASIGNTRVALGVFDLAPAGGIPCLVIAESPPLPLPPGPPPPLETDRRVDAAVLASVNPSSDPDVAEWIARAFGVEIVRFPQDVPPTVAVRCREPETVGPDRLANAVAACAEFTPPCVIVDAGTAITVDAVSGDRAFLGGAILPGLRLCGRALAEGTALLPEPDLAIEPPVIGATTAEAMASGVLRGLAGAVDRLVHDMTRELGGTARVLATGGDAARLAERCGTRPTLRPHLALTGLAVAFAAAHGPA